MKTLCLNFAHCEIRAIIFNAEVNFKIYSIKSLQEVSTKGSLRASSLGVMFKLVRNDCQRDKDNSLSLLII